MRTTLDCGCWRAVIMRKTPLFDMVAGSPTLGQALLDAAGNMQYADSEELEEGFCEEHSVVLSLRQKAVQAALEAGVAPEDAIKLLLGATPFPALGPGDNE